MCSSASNDYVYIDITVPSSVERGTSDDWIVDADDLVAALPMTGLMLTTWLQSP